DASLCCVRCRSCRAIGSMEGEAPPRAAAAERAHALAEGLELCRAHGRAGAFGARGRGDYSRGRFILCRKRASRLERGAARRSRGGVEMKLSAVLRVWLSPRRAHEENKRLQKELDTVSGKLASAEEFLARADAVQFVPPGHYYSPVPSKRDIEKHVAAREQRAFLAPLPAINMDDQTQLQTLECLK